MASILLSPEFYLNERFKFLNNARDKCLRSSEHLILEMPLHSTTFYDQFVTDEAVGLWNAFPVNIKKVQTVNSLKKMVQEFYTT